MMNTDGPVGGRGMDWLPTPEMSLLEAAERYITHGLRLVIVHGVEDGVCTCGVPAGACKPGKHPVASSWQKKKLETIEAFRDALAGKRMPARPNLGLVMGEQLDGTHLLAIDVDSLARLKALEEVVGELPETTTTRTGGGGSHRLFVLGAGQDPKRIKNRTGVRLVSEESTPGVDVRWVGGQIVVCPSLHESGGRYAWANTEPFAELPQRWFDLIAEPEEAPTSKRPAPLPGTGNVYSFQGSEPYVETVIRRACEDIAAAGKGERNHKLWTKTCTVLEHCAGAGKAFDRPLARLREAGVACGLPRGEVDATLRKAERHVRATGKTRTAPTSEPPSRVTMRPLDTTTGVGTDASASGERDASGEEREVEVEIEDLDAWRGRLIVERGRYAACIANVITVLTEHPAWKGVLVYDMFKETVVFTREPPCRLSDVPEHRPQGNVWVEDDDMRTQAWIHAAVGFEPSKGMVADAVMVAAARAARHPVRDYLNGLEWDGEERLPTMLANYFGATPNVYTAGIGTCWMISGVARVMKPGEQVDYMIVLEGPQGMGKSSGARALVPNASWFSDTGIVLGQKDSYLTLHGLWIYGFDELDALPKNEVTKAKSFLASTCDRLRPPYGRRMRDYPRQTIFIGTTNEDEYLRDRTGNRRFWPVECTSIDVQAIARDRDQLWAEAVVRFRRGERHWPSAELNDLCKAEQLTRMAQEPWVHPVAEWLESERARTIVAAHGGVLTHDVLVGALKFDVGDITKHHEMRAADALRELGWEQGKRRLEEGRRVRRFEPSAP